MASPFALAAELVCPLLHPKIASAINIVAILPLIPIARDLRSSAHILFALSSRKATHSCLKNPRCGYIGRRNREAAVVDRFDKAPKT
jgi:hypothetical protein